MKVMDVFFRTKFLDVEEYRQLVRELEFGYLRQESDEKICG